MGQHYPWDPLGSSPTHSGQHQLWDTLDYSASCPRFSPTHQQASTSFRTPQNPQLAMSRTSSTHHQANTRSGNPDATTTTPKLGSAHQWASARLETPGVLQPAALWPSPTNQQLAAPTQGRTWQPTRLGASHTYQTIHSSQPAATEGLSPHRGTPRAYSFGDQRGVCCWDS